MFGELDEEIANSSKRLMTADYTFGEHNKQIILSVIEFLSRPGITNSEMIPKSDSQFVAGTIQFFTSIFGPSISDRIRDSYKNTQQAPEIHRKQLIREASEILDKLSYKRQIEMYRNFLFHGLEETVRRARKELNNEPFLSRKTILGWPSIRNPFRLDNDPEDRQ